jgi:cation transport protein ChaC
MLFVYWGRRVGGNDARLLPTRTGTSGKGGIIINNNMVVAGGEPRWNAQLGVWEGNAANLGTKGVPSPLWIFGYGSLCWKADFPAEEQFVGRVSGWRRLFAQGSTDHRGTPAAPGLVATLLTDEQCESLRLRTPGEPASTCCGVCYRVGEADVEGVLGNLDFREKGGYTRDIVEVTPSEPGRPAVRALLYTANPENPNFRPPSADGGLEATAAVIAAARGPSGDNAEYLLKLADFLESVGERDEHVEGLAALVRRSQGQE